MQEANTELVVYPVPEGAAGNPDFSVKVRRPQGEWQPLFCHNVKVDMHEVRNASMVSFDCSGPVELEIVKNDGIVKEAVVRPLSADINCECERNVILLRLDGPRQLS